MADHVIVVLPHLLENGRNLYRAVCTCEVYRSGLHMTPEKAAKAGAAHVDAKVNGQGSGKKKLCAECRNKVSYPTVAKAQSAALLLARRAGKAWRAYPCSHGNGWHLTTQWLKQKANVDG